MQLASLATAALLLSASTYCRAAQAQEPARSESPSPPDPAAVRAFAGCYAFSLGPWSKPPTLGPDSPTVLVRLDTLRRFSSVLSNIFIAVRLAPVDTMPVKGRRPDAIWRLVPPDSVEVIPWSSRFEAEHFYGRMVGNQLRGVVRRTSDAVPVDPATGRTLWKLYATAPATGSRVPCPPAHFK